MTARCAGGWRESGRLSAPSSVLLAFGCCSWRLASWRQQRRIAAKRRKNAAQGVSPGVRREKHASPGGAKEAAANTEVVRLSAPCVLGRKLGILVVRIFNRKAREEGAKDAKRANS